MVYSFRTVSDEKEPSRSRIYFFKELPKKYAFNDQEKEIMLT